MTDKIKVDYRIGHKVTTKIDGVIPNLNGYFTLGDTTYKVREVFWFDNKHCTVQLV